MDGRDTVVMGIALRANAGEDIKAKLVLGQRQTPFRFGPVRFAYLGTRRIEAAPNLEGEPHNGLQGRDSRSVGPARRRVRDNSTGNSGSHAARGPDRPGD